MTPDQNPPVDPAAPLCVCGHSRQEHGQQLHAQDGCNHCTCLGYEPQTPAALAAVAETKVLPRVEIPEGYRLLTIGEIIRFGDLVWDRVDHARRLINTSCEGMEMEAQDVGSYFRPIDPVPHPEGRKCETCDDTRQVDSGGQNPDGSWINRECADCAAPSEAGEWGETFMRLGCDLARAEKQFRECMPTQAHRALEIMREAGDRWRDHIDSKAKAAPQAPAPSMWMADSRPLLAETASLRAQLDAHKAPEGTSPKAHSPAPWFVRFGGNYPEGPFYDITLEDRDYAPSIATLCARKDTKENAEFIVACVNSHSKLTAQVSTLIDAVTKAREALTTAIRCMDGAGMYSRGGSDRETFEGVKAVLALLESPALADLTNGGKA